MHEMDKGETNKIICMAINIDQNRVYHREQEMQYSESEQRIDENVESCSEIVYQPHQTVEIKGIDQSGAVESAVIDDE